MLCVKGGMLPSDAETCRRTLSLFDLVGKAENESLSKPYGQKQVSLRAVLQGHFSDA